MSRTHERTRRLTGMALLTAVIVVLQFTATFVKFGPFSITLALAPIVVGAAAYGIRAGAYFGGVFGLVALIASIFGWDYGGSMLWNASPFLTAVLCLLKGAAAGLVSGLIFRALRGVRPTAAVFVSAIAAPIVNTAIFVLAMLLFFMDILTAWAAGKPILSYIIFGMTGVNFLLEFAVNIILAPIIARILRIEQNIR